MRIFGKSVRRARAYYCAQGCMMHFQARRPTFRCTICGQPFQARDEAFLARHFPQGMTQMLVDQVRDQPRASFPAVAPLPTKESP